MQTCHILHDASKLRAVWLRLYAKARSSRIGQPRLETPIELWGDDVLERRTLRLLTSEMGWEPRRGVPGSHRFLPRKRRDDFYLIEGGRWLLVAKQTGSVLYYDLDEAIPKERVLIPDQLDDCHPSITSDVDNEGPFRLALHLLQYPCMCRVIFFFTHEVELIDLHISWHRFRSWTIPHSDLASISRS